MALKILLDTDIGDDIDDALAIALILASPELELLGVTTVFGNAQARARQARTLLKLAGAPHDSVPVSVGCSRAMTTVPYSGLMRSFADADRLPNQDGTCLPEAVLPPLDPRHGVDFLIDTIMQGDGDITLVMIGAMTNLAVAMVKEPRIISRIPMLAVMAAEFHHKKVEWNIRCDPEAAAIVFSSGIPIRLIPWHIGDVVQFGRDDVQRLDSGTSPLCQRLSDSIRAWQADRASDEHPEAWPIPRLYDPMSIATLVNPALCEWKTGTVRVNLQADGPYAATTFEEHADGLHQVAWSADRATCIEFFLNRVMNFNKG